MPHYLLLAIITLASCGNNDTGKGKQALNLFREELAQRPTEYANDPIEVQRILRHAVQTHRLHEYHNTRWFNHHGVFLVRSVVIDDQTFKLEID